MFEQFRETGVLTEAIRERLTSYRKMHGFSKYALARMLGVEAITVGRWERGETRAVHSCQRGMVADLLEGRLEPHMVCRNNPSEEAPNTELSQILWNVCEVYSVCNTPQKRKEFFEMLDALENKLRRKAAKNH